MSSAPEPDQDVQRLPIRRRPKYSAFMGIGCGIGVLIGVVWTLSTPPDPSVSTRSIMGYVCLFLGFIGGLLGGFVAMAFDRRS